MLVVTSLDDDGNDPQVGTLRHAIKQAGPRIVVFAVSGVIKLSKALEIKHDYISIEGQTSPGGIVISGAQTDIKADQVILRYLRFRPGKDQGEGDALTARRHSDIIIDHCSLSWSNDEVGSFYNNQNFTLQYSILSESLNNAGHHKGSHGYGGIWGGSRASFVHNLLAHHHSRNPRVNGYRLKAPYKQEQEFADIRNNVIYNWRDNSSYGGEGGRFNLVANYYRPGPASKAMRFFQLWHDSELPAAHAYIADNVFHGDIAKSQDNRLGIEVKNYKSLSAEKLHKVYAQSLVARPFWPQPDALTMPTETAVQSWQTLIVEGEIGANRNLSGVFHDSVDRRILSEVQGGTATVNSGIIDSELQVIESWQAYAKEFTTATVSWSLPKSSEAVSAWSNKLGQF